jgi:hypothetical protein
MKMAYFEIAVQFLNLGNYYERQLKMAQAEKMFTVAGTATQNGVTKARFANDMVARVKILTKSGCTNINLVELPRPMTKLEALQHLQTLGITEGDAGYAVANKLAEKTKVAKKAEIKVAVKPSKVAAKTRVEA